MKKTQTMHKWARGSLMCVFLGVAWCKQVQEPEAYAYCANGQKRLV